MGTDKKKRRSFLKQLFAASVSFGIASGVKANNIFKDGENKKIKMLTPEGKLVEVDANVLEKGTVSEKVSNSEVKEWMKKS